MEEWRPEREGFKNTRLLAPSRRLEMHSQRRIIGPDRNVAFATQVDIFQTAFLPVAPPPGQ